MGGFECKQLVEIVVEHGQGLAGDGEDEVEGKVVDACVAAGFHGVADAFGAVPAFEGVERFFLEALGADGHTVDAACGKTLHQLGGDGFGIGFDGEFGHTIEGALAV